MNVVPISDRVSQMVLGSVQHHERDGNLTNYPSARRRLHGITESLLGLAERSSDREKASHSATGVLSINLPNLRELGASPDVEERGQDGQKSAFGYRRWGGSRRPNAGPGEDGDSCDDQNGGPYSRL